MPGSARWEGEYPNLDVFIPMKLFSSLRYYIRFGDLSICVKDSPKEDEREEHRKSTCAATFNRANPRAGIDGEKQDGQGSFSGVVNARHYTYVALYFTKLFIRWQYPVSREWHMVSTCHHHHVTLAYLPSMLEEDRMMLEDKLDEVLKTYLKFDKTMRPGKLISSRCCIIHSPMERLTVDFYAGYTNFLEESWEEIEEAVADGRFDFYIDPKKVREARKASGDGTVPKDILMTEALRFWRRDVERKMSAVDKENTCKAKYNYCGVIESHVSECLVRSESEIQILLHYLYECLAFKCGIFHMQPQSEVGVLDSKSWHVTPQLCGMKVPNFAEYVQCKIDDKSWPGGAVQT